MVRNGVQKKRLKTINKPTNKRTASNISPPQGDNQKKNKKALKLQIPPPSKISTPKPGSSPLPSTSIRNFMLTNGKVLTPSKNEQITEIVSIK